MSDPALTGVPPSQAFSAPSFDPAVAHAGDLAESLFTTRDKGKAKNFKVVVRVRPLLERERRDDTVAHVHPDAKAISVQEPSNRAREGSSGKKHTFAFDRVYNPEASQVAVYTSAVRPVVDSVLEGYNGSIIAYGQTGTGKTFTVEGAQNEARGIIPRAAEDIFSHIENQSNAKSKYLVRVSFLQIYNEKIADLLDPDSLKKLDSKNYMKIRESVSGDVYVDGLTEHIVKSPTEVLDLLKLGATMRTTAATNMNRESSRSHAVFTIIVEHAEENEETNDTIVTIGKLNLVDLAGSERIKKTGVEAGRHLDEMRNINASLTTFGKVILALTSPGSQHIPYRDSKLTRILQGSLGGNCKTTMIAAVTPASSSYDETVSSLKFAKRAKHVKNYAMVNQDMSDQALLSHYQKEISRLKRELQAARTGDPSEFHRLRQQHSQLREMTQDMHEQLQAERAKSEMASEEKRALETQIQQMEQKLLTGGAAIQESPEFHAAVSEAEERLRAEYESSLSHLERERQRLNEKKRRLRDRQRQFLEKARTILHTGGDVGQLLTMLEPSDSDDSDTADADHEAAQLSATRRVGNAPVTLHVDAVRGKGKDSSASSAASSREPTTFSGYSHDDVSESDLELQDDQDLQRRSHAEQSPRSVSAQVWASRRAPQVSAHVKHEKSQTTAEGETVPRPPLLRPPSSSSRRRRHSSGRLQRPTSPLRTSTSADSDAMAKDVAHGDESEQRRAVTSTHAPPDAEASTALQRALAGYLQALAHPTTGIPTRIETVNGEAVTVFAGDDAAQWFAANLEGVGDEAAAKAVGQRFIDCQLITNINGNQSFQPSADALYMLAAPQRNGAVGREASVTSSSAMLSRHTTTVSSVSQTSNYTRSSTLSSTMSGMSSSSCEDADTATPLQHLARPTASAPRFHLTSSARVANAASASLSEQRVASARRPLSGRSSSMSALQVPSLNRGGVPQHEPTAEEQEETPQSAPRSPGLKRTTSTMRIGALFRVATLRRGNRSTESQTAVQEEGGMSETTQTQANEAGTADISQMAAVDVQGSEFGATLLHSAAGSGDKAALKTFLQTFPIDCLDHVGRSPLHYAAIGNQPKSLEILLKQGADPRLLDGNGRSALLWAAYYGFAEVARLLLKTDSTLIKLADPDGRSALHWSTRHDSAKCLETILRCADEEDLNQQDVEQVTALHWAVLCGHADHAAKLIKAGVDVAVADREGRTAIHYAVSGNNAACLQALLASDRAGEGINAKDQRGRTALHLAISSQTASDLIEKLLAHRTVDVNATDIRMTTPLHWAAVCNRSDVCELLVRHGAKLTFRDKRGMTALHYALEKGHQRCAEVLQRLAAAVAASQETTQDAQPPPAWS